MTSGRRFLRFHVVGALGLGVQVAVVGGLTTWMDVHYAAATAIGVVAAVVHNFAWHRRWTWADRTGAGGWAAFARFAGTNGAVSLGGTVLLVTFFVESTGIAGAPANAAGVAVSGLVNYWMSDRVVFR